MLQRMKISGKLILGFGLIALLLIVSAFVIFRSLMRIQTDTDYMVELARVSDDTNNVLVKILESRLSFNRVIANGNSDERGLAIGKAKEALDAVNQIASDLKIREIAEKLNELQDILKKFNTSTVVMLDYYINQHKEWNQQLATIENIKDLFDKSGQLGDLKSGNAARDAVIAFIGKFALSQDIEQQRGIVKSLNEKLDAFSSDITGLIASEKDASATATLKNMLGDISEYKKSVQRCLDFSEKIAAAKKEREVVAAKSVQLSDELSSYTTKLVLEKNDTLDTILNYYTVIIMTISMVTLFSVILIGLWLRNSVAVSLSKIVNVMKKVINEGDISVDIEDRFSHRYDEIGDLAKATESILDDYRSVTDLGQAAISGDWTHQIRIKSDKDVMNKNLDAMMEQVNIVLSKVTRSSADVLNGAQQVSNVSESLSQGATETAASLEEISASMHEMGSQTQKNADNAGEANSLARMASTSAESGQKMMQQMISSMEQITNNSKEVQRVVKVIDDIAFQTNLLALNAAVEAARAGMHGKGFAVVAEEVRNLAARCAKAAKETTNMIEQNNRQIRDGGDIANKTAEMLNEIVANVKGTCDLIGEIAEASKEQASGVQQVSQALQQIDTVTQRNTATSEETAGASNEMQAHAAELMQIMSEFKLRANTNASSRHKEVKRPGTAQKSNVFAEPSAEF